MTTSNLKAQNRSFENDAKTIDALMRASYEVVSGKKGAKRQWERDNYLHHPKALYSYFDRVKQEQVTMTLQEFHNETDEMVLIPLFMKAKLIEKLEFSVILQTFGVLMKRNWKRMVKLKEEE